MKHKQVPLEIEESTPAGGRIVISTGALDRQQDRVLPSGARIENYMKNPVVQWGHNYRDPWATIGETVQLEIGAEGITAEFTLREPANESDPQNIIRALWEQGLIRTASIGFNAESWEDNAEGGWNFTEWELLEWSLVPIPANQEALRLAVKSLEQDQPEGDGSPDTNEDPESEDADTELGPGDEEALAKAMDQLSAAMTALKQEYGG